jgi:hypothetical protein
MSRNRNPLAGLHELETFDRSVIPDNFKPEVKDAIEVAVMLGWKMHLSSANSVTIASYDGRKKYHFNTVRNSIPIKRVRRDIVKFADPQQAMLMMQSNKLMDSGHEELATLMAATMPQIGDPDTVVDHRAETEEQARLEQERRAQARAQRAAEKEEAKRRQAAEEEAKAAAVSQRNVPEQEDRIISEKPMLAKANEGRAYQSESAIERLWLSGMVDYKCTKCDYTNTNRLSIRGHYQVHSRGKGRSTVPPTFTAEVPRAVSYKPRIERVQALAAIIQEMLNADPGAGPSAEEVARQALTWVHEQSRKGTALSAEREDLGPEDTLHRIRTLLDDGSMFETRQRVTALEEQLLEAEARAEEAAARAEQAQSTLRAFMELASEFANENGEKVG